MISRGAFRSRERVGDDERLEAGERLEGNLGDLVLLELLDVDAAVMGERHRRRAEAGRVGEREVDLVLRRHARLEGHALRLGDHVADAVLGEEQPLLLLQRGLEVLGPAEQARLALLADAALEDRLQEDHAVALDQRLDLGLGGLGAEHLRAREAHEAKQLRAVEHASQLHGRTPPVLGFAVGRSLTLGFR